ncbi:hypothetical protein OG884_19890 [Streptosporangium sp. NBC_01755]|uniref:TetR family transcriptional regulator C-terminal domain-containing protein n=1 Tax=unclassified Streptosporangium TaxID=2632669 RepID=UPI002DDBBFB3|nr:MULTISPECIES: hypothetical protein [unclassified Streptosporangium]WSA24751.1 hypothetical protein OIE13_28010 [Streptosporangium sp. NBC_01810]WSC97170.1 hypothetical protein OG884_19890 [Streptosporangium sp. NBC_01755]
MAQSRSAGGEVTAKPSDGLRDLLAQARRDWLRLYEQTIRDAQQLGQLDADVDPAQPAFELDALATAANSAALLLDDTSAYQRSRAGIRTRLRALATRPEEVP